MALNIVYGRSGTGKSEYLYNKICENIGKTKSFLIVPEQSNLSAERRLFNISNIDSSIFFSNIFGFDINLEIYKNK